MDELVQKYKTESNALLQLYKKQDELKMSLDIIKKHLDDDHDNMLLTYCDAFTVYCDKMFKACSEKTKLVEDLKKQLNEQKLHIVSQLRGFLDTLQNINNLDGNNDDEAKLMAQCANVLYGKIDNHDLRAEPPVCGSVFKDNFRKYPFSLSNDDDSKMMAQCANVLYDKTDNHDLRAEPL